MKTTPQPPKAGAPKKVWIPPEIRLEGRIEELARGGGGKSGVGGDPGESRKPVGMG